MRLTHFIFSWALSASLVLAGSMPKPQLARKHAARAVQLVDRSAPPAYTPGPGHWNRTTPFEYPRWQWGKDSSHTMYGVNLGNFFVLEQWMDAAWFNQTAPGAEDMWHFIQKLGPQKATKVLEHHYDTWINEVAVQRMHEAGVNTVRIGMGYWSWMKTNEGEPYIYANDLYYLERILGWLYTRGMYAMLDMHAMPGGQNGGPTGGHNTAHYSFFTDANQHRSDHVINSVGDYIRTSKYGNVVSSVLVVNEPCGNTACAGQSGTPNQGKTLEAFYERSYKSLSQKKIPMVFHHGWVKYHLLGWLDFVKDKDPNLLIGSDNPYPGGFSAGHLTNKTKVLQKMCSFAKQYAEYPVPVVATEFSMVNSIADGDFNAAYYKAQVANYAKAGGSAFWSYRVRANYDAVQWSWTAALNRGLIPRPKRAHRAATMAKKWIDSWADVHKCAI